MRFCDADSGAYPGDDYHDDAAMTRHIKSPRCTHYSRWYRKWSVCGNYPVENIRGSGEKSTYQEGRADCSGKSVMHKAHPADCRKHAVRYRDHEDVVYPVTGQSSFWYYFQKVMLCLPSMLYFLTRLLPGRYKLNAKPHTAAIF